MYGCVATPQPPRARLRMLARDPIVIILQPRRKVPIVRPVGHVLNAGVTSRHDMPVAHDSSWPAEPSQACRCGSVWRSGLRQPSSALERPSAAVVASLAWLHGSVCRT